MIVIIISDFIGIIFIIEIFISIIIILLNSKDDLN